MNKIEIENNTEAKKYKKASLQERMSFEQEGISFSKIDFALISIIDIFLAPTPTLKLLLNI